MKNTMCFFGALILTITSCSSNDNDSETAILPKTIKFSKPNYPSENTTSTITYSGNKLVSVTDEEDRTDFTYEGNVIVKAVTYDITAGKSDKKEEKSFLYTNGKLTSTLYARNFTSQYPFGQYKGRFVYSYNGDGTVTKESYSTNAQTGIESKNDYLEVYTFENGNLIKLVATDTGSGVSSVRASLYEYDSKNNPFKNVLGFNLLIDEDDSNVNNLIKHTYSYTGSSMSYFSKTTYEYNTNGYPVKITVYLQDGVTIDEIREYTY
ncbi:DUF2963 domain-containing protein [Flavobacterium sp. YO64]|uniref:DUF2963 domain-containing protein n=1 Tax=Flavobacterium sp. YO64 TaxID=394559 RepID=UPI00100C343F|nr:hypothetical protein [Flavobacterium sp. YO64]RXM43138.1 hypothetical protein BOW57_14120 [Flavobacterium sp. YO64]